ncbi:MAG: YoaK family protein [Tissierella sp.]|uniref:YoaK family protein n=1 Tax=Tissierella sp. TaxID=41274 RepID=UPI003F9980A3
MKIKKSTQINCLRFCLSMTAGWVNAVAINHFFSESPAFMSGRGIMMGYHVFKGNLKAFMGVALVVISFITGSVISTILTKRKGLSGGLFLVGGLISTLVFPIFFRNRIADIIIISMAMGAQNASTSLTPINRTTHLTGPATDIGINIAEKNWNIVIFWLLHWISFPFGAIIGFNLVDMVNNKMISISSTFLFPTIVVLSIAIIQKRILHIPLLEDMYKIENTKYKEI